ncbi:putative methyltransferase NSUN7 [Nerophis ophidion]|uniref:putative methyltransferase NSUN7 n=1 Tax=Nerophis ophidion TaxID=159077 RepID=UPI002AE06AC5|nr:putative methyltransferase NSUN7 [Nerophis ophidion]
MEDKKNLASPLPHPATHLRDDPPSDLAYLQAAAIFQYLRTDKPLRHQLVHYGRKPDALSLPQSGDKATTRRALQLAFRTLKYQDLLEEMVTDSRLQTWQHIPGDLLPLAMVMLCNLQERKFLPRERRPAKEGEEPRQEVRDLENTLHKCKTKLAASLARCRVKHGLRSVSCILSESVRTRQHVAKILPLYAWVNTLRSSVEEVCEELQLSGLTQVDQVSDGDQPTFSRDPLCPDTLVFSPKLHAVLKHSRLTATHTLNLQDRSVCVAVSALPPLLLDNAHVLVVGSFSALTVAHVAVLAAARSGVVLLCGADLTSSQLEDLHRLLREMDIGNVRVLSETFFHLAERDAAIERLKVVMVLPRCSSSALSDPVDIIHCEHGDWDLLQDLSRGSVTQSNLHKLMTQQARLLAHALSFPQAETVLYCTRSVHGEENEQLVNEVLERTLTPSKRRPFRLNPHIFPEDTTLATPASNFFRLECSEVTNGCFMARLTRQADSSQVQEVLARAAANGLLEGVFPARSEEKKVKSRKQVEDKDGGAVTPKEEGGKRGRKKKGKRKKELKQSKMVTKHHSVSRRKKKTGSRKPTVKIPRLTLTLISAAKPSTHAFAAAAKTPAASAQRQPCPGVRPATQTLPSAPKAGGPKRIDMEEVVSTGASGSPDVLLVSSQACSSESEGGSVGW